LASPMYAVGVAGVTTTEVMPTTVKAPSPAVVVLTTEPYVADMLIGPPPPVPLATPAVAPEVLIVATAPLLVPQVTVDVRSCVELSENVPVAVNCCVPP